MNDDAEIDRFLKIAQQDYHRTISRSMIAINHFATVPKSFVKRVLNAGSSIAPSGDGVCVAGDTSDDIFIKEETVVQMKSIGAGTTRLHRDRYLDLVGFVFLNSNPNATFYHGSVPVPIEKGNLVLFHGSVPHQTVVQSGHVNLLGPFHVDPEMQFGDEQPTGCSGYDNEEACQAATFANSGTANSPCCSWNTEGGTPV
ncbi:MAG: hypothetical protein SGARI_004887, partial [Bacillariaceae sp.]